MNIIKSTTVSQCKEFNEESDEYYPPACCEILHVTNAVYVATFLQIIFVITISILYHFLERNAFVSAIEIFRPAVGFIICINLIGILFALVGVILQQSLLISAQIALLAGLVIISDIIALTLIIAMASSGWNSNQKIYEIGSIGANTFSSIYFVNEQKFESILGPFWVYLTAIIFHMCAAVIMCIIGVYRRYAKFLKDKFNYSRVHSYEAGENVIGKSKVGSNLLQFN